MMRSERTNSVREPDRKAVMRRQNIAAVKRHWQLYLMLLPALIYIILFAYKPMYGVLIAFQDYSLKKGVWGSE